MNLRRMTEVIQILTEEGLGFLVRREVQVGAAVGGGTPGDDPIPPDAQKDVEIARRLRRAFERLGPTFVKFGQILATRVDVFPEEFCAELGKLHSKAAPLPFPEIAAVLEEELKRPLTEIFADFDETPLAAASIAQAHAATLPNGRKVVVKVQRPHAKAQVLGDMDVLITMSGWLDRIFTPYRRTMVHRIVQEQRQTAVDELDFRNEADTARRLRAHHAEDRWVKIPEVFDDLTTERVLVIERLFGRKLDELRTADDLRAQGLEPETLARRMLTIQIKQAYQYGLLHADMHPGNVFILPGGDIGLIDFGLHVEVRKELRDSMLRILRLRAQGRCEDAAEVAAGQIMRPTSRSDVAAYKRAYAECIRKTLGTTIEDMSLGKMLLDESRIAGKFEMIAPPELLAVARGLLIVDGLILKYCPGFRLDLAAGEIIGGIMREKVSLPALLEQMKGMVPDLIEAFEKSPEFSRALLRVREHFGGARNLKDFLEREGFSRAAKPAEGAVLRLLVAFAAGAVTAAAMLAAFMAIR